METRPNRRQIFNGAGHLLPGGAKFDLSTLVCGEPSIFSAVNGDRHQSLSNSGLGVLRSILLRHAHLGLSG